MNESKRYELLAKRSSRTALGCQRHCNSVWHHGRLNCVLPTIYIPQLTSVRLAACLALASLLSLGGCTAMKVKLGMRVYLAKTPVTSMQASLPRGPAIAPGEKLALVVKFTQPDGKVLATEGKGAGKVLWGDIVVTPTVVRYDNKGNISRPHDSRKSRGGSGGAGTPNGNNGRDGSDGRNGFDGSPGRGGSITVTYDPQAKPYLSAIKISNKGGPAPVFREEPVGPLW